MRRLAANQHSPFISEKKPFMGRNLFAIASRRSPLAQTQARHVRGLLAGALGLSGDEREARLPIETFVTSGDRNLSGPLAAIGGKGLFTKEVEAALLSGAARFAVHSMKDMPAETPEGLVTAGVPPREDPRDCFLSPHAQSPWELPEGAVVGAASVRRIAQTLARRPDLKTVALRGNVATRLEKLAAGEADATFLALAGLRRLGLAEKATRILAFEDMLPAAGQGALCIQTRKDDREARALAQEISCPETTICVEVERAFLAGLDGSCRTPIAGLARIREGRVHFRGELLSLDGQTRFETERDFSYDPGDVIGARTVGGEAAREIRARAGGDFFKQLELG